MRSGAGSDEYIGLPQRHYGIISGFIFRHHVKAMRSTRRQTNTTLRSDIAHEAARLVVEGGCRSFAVARHKAAARMGIDNLRNLPDNVEIHSALIEYQRIFEGDRLCQRIEAMRREALAAMVVFEHYTPRLVGPVLYGSACDHSPVTLHLYTDESESVTRLLCARKIDYRLTETTLNVSSKHRDVFPTYQVVNRDLDFELVVLGLAYLVHPPLSSLNGRPMKSANAADLSMLIDAEQALGSNVAGGEIASVARNF